MKSEYTDAEYDQLSWHDNEIYGFEFRVGDPASGDWSSDLVFDIDFIVEWVRRADGMRFLISPATLVFHGVTDLVIDIRSGTTGNQVGLTLPSIAAIEREPVAEQKVFMDQAYYRWRVRLNGYPHGEFVFGAAGFTQALRRDPVLCEQQRLASWLRTSL